MASSRKTTDDAGGNHSIGTFVDLTDLASARVGGRAVAASDDFFAPKSNLLKPQPAIFVPGKFTARGKWMDGWESRRRRTPGHDWCIVSLGIRGRIRGVNVDTHHFDGNQPSLASIDALDAGARASSAQLTAGDAPWATILTERALGPDRDNFFAIEDAGAWTHVRLNIVPDGGVARLRVFGEPAIDWARLTGRRMDLASILNGGRVLGASDMHFGARDNLIMPGRARNMGDGWETRRRRGPGHDWAIVQLGAVGILSRIEIDTNHFKGNYPESASIEGCVSQASTVEALASASWIEILPRVPLRPHHRHIFPRELRAHSPVSHVRLNIFPDGGVSRLRVYGTVAPA
jgi:allantoicase